MAVTEAKLATLVKDSPKPIYQLPHKTCLEKILKKAAWKINLKFGCYTTQVTIATLVKDLPKPIDQLVIPFSKNTCVKIIIRNIKRK